MKKKIFKTLIITIIGIFLMFVFNKFVSAEITGKLKIEEQSGIFYTMRGGTVGYMSGAFPYYTVGGDIVYCIEPGVQFFTHNYIGKEGLVNSPYSAEVNSKLQLIGYYGYEYPGHQKLRYRMATQALIWEVAGNTIVEFWTEKYGYGDPISVETEKKEIMNLVNNHYNRPSFNGETLETQLGEEITLEDSSNTLSQFEIYDDGGNEVKIENNKLYITTKKINDSTITLIKKGYDNKTTIIFIGDNSASQKLGLLRAGDPVITKINLNTKGVKVKVIKIDAETNKQISMSGIKFKIKNLDTNEYMCQDTICEFETDTNGVLITPYELSGNYQLEEVENQLINGYLWNNNPIKFTINNDTKFDEDDEYGKVYTIRFANNRVKGKVEINKKGESVVFNNNTFSYTKIPLKNVKFGLYANEDIKVNGEIIYSKNKLVKEITTNENGNAVISNLELGKYYLLELSTDSNHILDTKKYEFELKYKDQYTQIISKTINIDNYYKKGTLEFTKTDLATGKVVLNATIEIYTIDNKLIYSGKTDSNGKITIQNLFVGKFYIVEKIAPTGYVLNTEKAYFEILENCKVVKATMTNEKIKGTLELTKVDFSKSEPLPNTTIEIYDSNNKLIYTGKTDKNGKITINNLQYGKYYIIEKEASIGYLLNTEKMYFEILENGKIIKSTMKDEKITGTLEFMKIDFSTSEPLPNTTIEIYDSNDKLIYTGKTDKNGKIVINKLEYGKYYIIEKNAPEGYVLNTEKMYFEILENGKVVKATMTNEKITGTLEFTKVDFSTSEPLPNTTIEIYTNDNKLIYSGKTDKNGKIFINKLQYGKYYIVEKQAPEGYVLNTEKMYFEILENGKVVKATMTNEKIKGSLHFTKVDISTGEPLPNTTIEIYNMQNELIFTGITDEEGIIIIEGLEYGRYYLKEKEAPEGYVLSEGKMYFEILMNGETFKATMTNEKIKGTLEFTKIDFSTSEPLPNTLIQIYTENDELVFEGTTDKTGMIVINELEYGKYYILEKEAPEGYILNEEKMYFEILENGEIIKATMVNEKVIVEVPITGINEYPVIYIVSGILLLSGIGIIIYAKKKSKR